MWVEAGLHAINPVHHRARKSSAVRWTRRLGAKQDGRPLAKGGESDADVIKRVIGVEDGNLTDVKKLSAGFCNQVMLVRKNTPDGGEEALVVKLYSNLALLRTSKTHRGVVDKLLDELNLGPQLVASTDEGIAHRYLEGRILTEEDMHTRSDICAATVRLVATFHSLEVPPQFDDAKEPLLWSWLECMLEAIRTSSNVDRLPAGIDLPALRREVDIMANTVKNMELSVVLSHGDLKPSNVMLVGDDPKLMLIDLELSGPNYRGFDLMKLFRTDPARFSEARFSDFLSVYCETAKVDESLAREIKKETKIFEPLTWLEAAVFFGLVVAMGQDFGGPSSDKARWEALLRDRWAKYMASKDRIEAFE